VNHHIDAKARFFSRLLERAGMTGLREGQKVSFDTEEDRRSGKIAVATIQAA
jgi:CspA family cold shock protein